MRNQVKKLQACSWALLTDVKSATDEKAPTDVKKTTNVTDKPGNGSRNRLDTSGKSYKAGNLGANSVDSEMGERISLTIDSGCAACALPVGVASAVGMQELNRAPQEHIAANAEKILELGFKTPTLKFQNGDVQNLKFSVTDKLHKPLVTACKVVAAGIRIVESQGGSFIEDVRSKRRKRIFERNGVYVLPCWLVKQNPKSVWHLWTSRTQTIGRFVRKTSHDC